MPYREAKEHATCRLHAIFADPYSAFENPVIERLLHLRVAIQALVLAPMTNGNLTLRVIHGWENGGFEPADLKHSDHPIGSLGDMQQVAERYRQAFQAQQPLPYDAASLLAAPLDEAIARAEAGGQSLDEETRTIPARWPAFPQGLYLYTFFKVYHRLIYGEDDTYRSIHCETRTARARSTSSIWKRANSPWLRPSREKAARPCWCCTKASWRRRYSCSRKRSPRPDHPHYRSRGTRPIR